MIRTNVVVAAALTLGLVLSGCPGSGQSPVIVQFSASPTSLPSGGGAVTLTWSVNGATSLSINQGVGAVTPATSGSVGANVTSTTSFTLSATNSSGTSTSMVQVTVGSTAGPTIASVVPSAGPTSGGTVVTITGTNFQSGATVEFGSAAATDVTVNSATSISATTPAGSAGAVTVTVNSGGQSATLPGGFTFTTASPPTITSVSPSAGPTAGGTAVTITGTNFLAGATVTFGSAAATGVTVNSATSISATTPAGAAGAVNVTVTNSNEEAATLTGGFTYTTVPAPSITSVSPSSGPVAGGTAVTITGANFQSGATVQFGTAAATGVTFNSATSISATTPAGAAGAVAVTVTNPDHQSATLSGGFAYILPGPSITTVSPGSGLTAGGTVVTITGANFQSGATVKFGTVAATGVTFTSATSISSTSPAGSFGTVDVTVTNPDTQSATLAGGFSYLRLIEREQSDATAWGWYYNETAAGVDTLLTNNNARPVDISVQTVVSGVPYFSVIFVTNTGAYATTWNWYCCDTAAEFEAHLTNSRVISWSPYYNGTTVLYASVMVDNTGLNNLGWYFAAGSGSYVGTFVNGLSNQRVVDLENWDNNGTTEYAVLTISNTGVEAASYWAWWFGITNSALATDISNHSAQLLTYSDDPGLSNYDATERAPATAGWYYLYGFSGSDIVTFANTNHARPTSARVEPTSIAGGVGGYLFDVVLIAD